MPNEDLQSEYEIEEIRELGEKADQLDELADRLNPTGRGPSMSGGPTTEENAE